MGRGGDGCGKVQRAYREYPFCCEIGIMYFDLCICRPLAVMALLRTKGFENKLPY